MSPENETQNVSRKNPAIHTNSGMAAMMIRFVHSKAVRLNTIVNKKAIGMVNGKAIGRPPTVIQVPKYTTSNSTESSAPRLSHANPQIISALEKFTRISLP